MPHLGDIVELKTYRHYLEHGLISGDRGVIESEIKHDNLVIGYTIRFSNGLEDIIINAGISEIKVIASRGTTKIGLAIGVLLVLIAILGLISLGIVSESTGLICLAIISIFVLS